MNNKIVAGIDIGGSHITVALVDLKAHSIIPGSLIRRHVNSKGNTEQIIKEWTGAIANCKACHPDTSKKIGIAMPGPFDYKRGISLIKDLDKYEALYNLNVKELLADELQIEATDIFMMNDASCFLKGEVFGGAARDRNNVIGITLGTGLGSATFKDEIVYDGDLYYAPYKDSFAEEYLSTRWFIKRYKELSGTTVKNVKEIGQQIASDESASIVFAEFGYNLGEVLAAYIKKHNAENVVIGGNIINAWELFINEAKQVLQHYSLQVSLVKASLGEEAALMGAASLCAQ
ncbi:MAG: ROK family protein [Chitinophagaceae bacterium]|nr:ROK family protein [Chitinophagaceae bacterium]